MNARTATALLAAAALLAGCATRTIITPPEHVTDPASVYVLDFGKHSSLLLPLTDDPAPPLREYSYGQWEWYALGQDEWHRGSGTLLAEGHGALGRGDWSPASDAESVARMTAATHVHEVIVERARAQELLATLDARWETGAAIEHVFNAGAGLDFARDPQMYSMKYNCNTAVAEWLRLLGCHVTTPGLIANYRVRTSKEKAPAEAGARFLRED